MAEKRMFAKSIVLSDAFLDMPLSARCLYFTLGMLADDEGFVGSPKAIMRQCGASMDDMNVLISKRYVLVFDSGVIVIKHWRINNFLRNDRTHETTYLEEKSTLAIDEKGSYTEANGFTEIIEEKPISKKPLSVARQKRLDAIKESDLPYTFDQKIRNAFVGKHCPICGVVMSYEYSNNKPTIQHNKPISLGGKHEIDNISVICASCNSSIQNRTETPPYNTDEVRKIWECVGNGAGMDTENILDKNRLDKNKNNRAVFVKPSVDEVSAYCKERNNGIDANDFVDFYESKGWMIGKNKMKDWKAAVRTWERSRKNKPADKQATKFSNFEERKQNFEDLDSWAWSN